MKKKWLSSKILLSVTAASLIFGTGSAVYAANAMKKITAYQNSAISIEVGGDQVDLVIDGTSLDPITYQGRTYVPARPVAEALGATVGYDEANKVVIITPEGMTPPKVTPPPAKDKPTNNNNNNGGSNSGSSTGQKSTNKGTLEDPVKLGTSFTYYDADNYKPEEFNVTSANYTVTVHGVKDIPSGDHEKYRFEAPKDGLKLVLVDLSVKVTNAKFKKAPGNKVDSQYLSSYRPYFSGSMTADKSHVVYGSSALGFEGSLSDAITKVNSDFPKVFEGDSKGYEVRGKVAITVKKDKESYLEVRRYDSTLDYNDRSYYFKLK